MIVKKMSLTNQLGLHLRAAAQLAQTASKYKCKILVKNHNGRANGKSIINLLSLAAIGGSEVTVVFEGKDAHDAWTAIHNLFNNKFGEA
jgi:phosphocarrier protein